MGAAVNLLTSGFSTLFVLLWVCVLLVYTDGLTESFNGEGDMLGIEGLAEIAQDAYHLPLVQMKQEILDRVAAWSGRPCR